MAFDFRKFDEDPEPQASGAGQKPPSGPVIATEMYEHGDPTPPPAGLMRKRAHVVFWIFLALVLGGILALAMIAFDN